MATVADLKPPKALVRPIPDFFQQSRKIPYGLIFMSDEVDVDDCNFQSDKLFIRLLNSLVNDYRLVKSTSIPQDVKSLFEQSASFLLELNPEKINIELSYEDSLVFTLVKNDVTIFFERYYDDNNVEEVIFSHYIKGEKQPSFSGTFEDAKIILSTVGLSR